LLDVLGAQDARRRHRGRDRHDPRRGDRGGGARSTLTALGAASALSVSPARTMQASLGCGAPPGDVARIVAGAAADAAPRSRRVPGAGARGARACGLGGRGLGLGRDLDRAVEHDVRVRRRPL